MLGQPRPPGCVSKEFRHAGCKPIQKPSPLIREALQKEKVIIQTLQSVVIRSPPGTGINLGGLVQSKVGANKLLKGGDKAVQLGPSLMIQAYPLPPRAAAPMTQPLRKSFWAHVWPSSP